MRVTAQDDLRSVAFKVCTALRDAGVTAVLTGGSAATVYTPEAYQSGDLDFVLQFSTDTTGHAERALQALGYTEKNGQYLHEENPLTLEFLKRPIQIGMDTIETWDTLGDGGRILHILSPTDCCRDRLAHFLHWNDRSVLSQSAVARDRAVDLETFASGASGKGIPGNSRSSKESCGDTPSRGRDSRSRPPNKTGGRGAARRNGAEDGTRTRDNHLGKVELYQLSYFRSKSIPHRGAKRL